MSPDESNLQVFFERIHIRTDGLTIDGQGHSIDANENGRIFELSQELDAEHTYYLYVENWDVAFDMTIHVTKPVLYAEAEEVEYIQNVGKPITLKVNADSPFPLTYEWRNTKDNVISGATTDTYVYTPKSVGAQTFTCKVSDGNNSKTVKFHFSVADFVDLTPVNETVTADYGTKVVLKTTVDSPTTSKEFTARICA